MSIACLTRSSVTEDRVKHAIEIGGTGDGRMPANLYDGYERDAVAYYVSTVAGR